MEENLEYIWKEYFDYLGKNNPELDTYNDSENISISEDISDSESNKYLNPGNLDNYIFSEKNTKLSRTYISKNKRLDTLNKWISSDSYQSIMYRYINDLREILAKQTYIKIDKTIINDCVKFYKYISNIYRENKKSKSNISIFIFAIYTTLKYRGYQHIKLDIISKILNIDRKNTYKKYKKFLEKNNKIIKNLYNDSTYHGIYRILESLKIPEFLKYKIVQSIINTKEINCKQSCIYGSIIYYYTKCYGLSSQITLDNISKECNVSKNLIIKYYKNNIL